VLKGILVRRAWGLIIKQRKEMSRETNPVCGIMKVPYLFVLIG